MMTETLSFIVRSEAILLNSFNIQMGLSVAALSYDKWLVAASSMSDRPTLNWLTQQQLRPT